MKADRVRKMLESPEERFACVWSTVSVLVASQVRALRLHSGAPRQKDFAKAAGMQQSLISRYETPGANVTLETLAKIAAASSVALKVEFVPFSEMQEWERNFSQDRARVTPLGEDEALLRPPRVGTPAFTASGVIRSFFVHSSLSSFQSLIYANPGGPNPAPVALDICPLTLPLIQPPRLSELVMQDNSLRIQTHAGAITYAA